MKKFIKKNYLLLLNILVVIGLFFLPYLLFQGKLYLGGDDTKLQYVFPAVLLRDVHPFSWYHFSSLGWNNPVQFELPFLIVWSFLDSLIRIKFVLNYLGFSLPLIAGFVYFQKFLTELLEGKKENHKIEAFLASLFYVLSPIIIVNQLINFLISIWLLALIPANLYFFVRYLKTSRFIYVFLAMVLTTLFSIALFSIPWILGYVAVLVPSMLVCAFLFKKSEIIYFLKKLVFFFFFILLSQAFWLYGFLNTYLLISTNSFAAKVVSKQFLDTFSPVVLSTARGTIIYPLLNLFNRQIAFDFNWDLKNVFLNFYDKTMILNSIYLIILVLALINLKKALSKKERKIFILFFGSFILALFFFTVNIGPLKELFLFLRNFPGFVVFRNFYDKFAPTYVTFFSIVIFFSLVIVRRSFKKASKILLIAFGIIVLVNFIPVEKIVNSPIWQTSQSYKHINFPKEYINFMKEVSNKIPTTNNLLSVPFGSSVYSVIKDETSNNVYVGVSPVIVFSGLNDISGHLSFNFTEIANLMDGLIVNRNYSKLNSVLYQHNINYVVVTKNIPKDALNADWLFGANVLKKQDKEFLDSITSRKLLTSEEGNYELYQAKKTNSLISSKNVYFQKISPVKYVIYVKNLEKKQLLSFVDSYHTGWKLYLKKNPSLSFCLKPTENRELLSYQCKEGKKIFEPEDLSFLYLRPVFDEKHGLLNDYANKWEIDPSYVKHNFDSFYYKENKNGSIDIELVLYFKPQTDFFIGVFVSIVVFLGSGIYLILKNKNEKLN